MSWQQQPFTVLCLDYPGELVPEETFTHPPSWLSSNPHQLLPSTTTHSILPVQITCLAIFLHNLSPRPLWSTSWSGALHLIFHTFLHPITVFFSQNMTTSHTTAIQPPSPTQWYIPTGKQWYQLTEFIPSNSDSGLHRCISISIHTQRIT